MISRKIILTTLLLLLSFSVTFAQYDELCQACHADNSIEPVTEKGEILDLYLPVEVYQSATHGEMECTMCHIESEEGGFEEFPHLLDAASTPMCLDCHGDEFEEQHAAYELSYHAEKIQDFNCFKCHDIHRANFDSLTQDLEHEITYYNDNCYNCHVDSAIYAYLSGKDASKLDLSHSFLPSREIHWRSVRCVECHTPAEDANVHHIVADDEAQHKCVSCHSQNSILTHKLYQSATASEDDQLHRILNYYLFQNAYVIGATRLTFVDNFIILLFLAALAGVLTHGALRIYFTRNIRKNGPEYELHSEYIYKLNIRIWHATNAILFIILIFTGFSLHFANEGSILDFAVAVNIHNNAARLLMLAFAFYLAMNFFDGNIKHYIPGPHNIHQRLLIQARYYVYGIFRGEEKPYHCSVKHKFNPLQRFSYLVVMFFLFPVIIITGLLLMFPELAPIGILGIGGLGFIALMHYFVAVMFVLFMIVHIYLGTTGDKPGFLYQAIVTGYHKAFHRKENNQ